MPRHLVFFGSDDGTKTNDVEKETMNNIRDFQNMMVWICFCIDGRIWERKDPAWHFLWNFGCLTTAHIATLRNDSGLVLAPASIGNQAVSF